MPFRTHPVSPTFKTPRLFSKRFNPIESISCSEFRCNSALQKVDAPRQAGPQSIGDGHIYCYSQFIKSRVLYIGMGRNRARMPQDQRCRFGRAEERQQIPSKTPST